MFVATETAAAALAPERLSAGQSLLPAPADEVEQQLASHLFDRRRDALIAFGASAAWTLLGWLGIALQAPTGQCLAGARLLRGP